MKSTYLSDALACSTTEPLADQAVEGLEIRMLPRGAAFIARWHEPVTDLDQIVVIGRVTRMKVNAARAIAEAFLARQASLPAHRDDPVEDQPAAGEPRSRFEDHPLTRLLRERAIDTR